MLQNEVLVSESTAINALPASPISLREIAALDHELWDDPMELATLISKTFISCTEDPKVLRGNWHDILSQLKNNSSGILLSGDFYVKIYARVYHGLDSDSLPLFEYCCR